MEHPKVSPRNDSANRTRTTPTVASVLDDGRLLEMVYDPKAHTTAFVLAQDGKWTIVPHHDLPDGRRLMPFAPLNNLLTHEVLLLPTGPEEYDDRAALIERIQAYIHRYVDLSPTFERIAVHYVLLSWVYDGFHELPYLRVRGEPGSGKTRFLLTVGSLCNKPIFASGASTVSPLFRMLDSIRGTLVLDEADFRFSDARSEVVKILNNGTTKGFPVLRAEADASSSREFNPTAFHVFGPKLIAARGPFEDPALETRFISEQMGTQGMREDIAISLSASHAQEAVRLRNQLLLFRIREHGPESSQLPSDRTLEPRLNQMFGPLLSMIDDEPTRADVLRLAHAYHSQIRADRGADVAGQVLEVVRDLRAQTTDWPSVREIARVFGLRHCDDFRNPVTPRWVGQLLRRRLGLATVRRRNGYVIPPTEAGKIEGLLDRYGLTLPSTTPGSPQRSPSSPPSPTSAQSLSPA